MTISGAIYAIGGFALLAFGLYWKRASKVGAYLSIICGFLALLGLAPLQKHFDWLFEPIRIYFGIKEITSAMVGLSVLALAILLMIVGSMLFPDRRTAFDYRDCKE